MKRTITLAAAVLALTGCAAIRDLRPDRTNPYEEPPFYAKYLDTGSPLDERITQTLDELRQNPGSAELHNDLGALLVEKGFPKDAEREFERAVDADRRYHPGWYNLGLVRAARGDEPGARRALSRTVALKPGHAAALFQLGLIEEKRQHVDRAVALYAKAYRINPALLEVEVNPRVLDSKLTHRALLVLYPSAHTRESMQLQDAPVIQRPRVVEPEPAPSPQAELPRIVTPVPPAPPTMQSSPAPAPAMTGEAEPARRRRTRPRRVSPPPTRIEEPPVEAQPAADETAIEQPSEVPPVEIPADEVPPETPEEEPPPPPPGR